MKSSSGKSRAGAVRKGKKGPQVGSGGQGRQALEGKKPTPKAEDRPYHPAGRRTAAQERYTAAGGSKPSCRTAANGRPDTRSQGRTKPKSEEAEIVTGRN